MSQGDAKVRARFHGRFRQPRQPPIRAGFSDDARPDPDDGAEDKQVHAAVQIAAQAEQREQRKNTEHE